MAAPEQKEAARREPDGGKAGEALRQDTPRGAFVKTTAREVAAQVRKGMAAGFDGIVIGYRLKRWRPGNDALIDQTLRAVWDFEERYGEPAKERYARRDKELGDL